MCLYDAKPIKRIFVKKLRSLDGKRLRPAKGSLTNGTHTKHTSVCVCSRKRETNGNKRKGIVETSLHCSLVCLKWAGFLLFRIDLDEAPFGDGSELEISTAHMGLDGQGLPKGAALFAWFTHRVGLLCSHFAKAIAVRVEVLDLRKFCTFFALLGYWAIFASKVA